MLLQRLLEVARSRGDAGPSMYKKIPVRYEVQLDREGNVRGFITLSGGDTRRDRGKPMLVPVRQRSGTLPKPILLADTIEYVLGLGRPEKASLYHTSFHSIVHACADATCEPDVRAVARFLDQPLESRSLIPPELDPGIVTFSVDGRFPVDLPRVRAFWAAHVDRASGAAGQADHQCIVCGEWKPIVDRYPLPIKGVVGAQGSGAALVTANANAFESYGLTKSHTAPTCSGCAEAVSQTLNALIEDDASRLRVAPLTYVFWSREQTTFRPGMFLSRPDPEEVAGLLRSVHYGRPGATQLDVRAFYCVALAGNSGRVVVRDWIDTTVGEAQRSIARFFLLQRLVDRAGDDGRSFGLNVLARATLREGARDDPSPVVPQALMRSALMSAPLPDTLIAQIVHRIQSDGQMTHVRMVVIKMVLVSGILGRHPDGWEDPLVELDESNRDPAYLCGRLLAVLDNIQRTAIGSPNATVIDRYFGAASTAPVSVFGRLIQGAQPHLGKLRRQRPGAYGALDTRLQEILSGLDAFPRTLNIRQQGVFALGFYHQRAADSKAVRERKAARGLSDESSEQDSEVPSDVID